MLYKDKDAIAPIQSTCGELREVISDKNIGMAVVDMTTGVTESHFHQNTTEYYVVLEGQGKLRISEVGKEPVTIHLKPGTFVRIDPWEIHQTESEGGLKVMTVTRPAWTVEDETNAQSLF